MKRVLLIDDDQRFLQALTRELLIHGYRVEEATDGLEGIAKAMTEPPDIAVVDLIMPRVGGAEVISFFRQNPYLASTPTILLSGVLLESASAVNSIEADCIVPKGPFAETSRLLLEAIDKLSTGTRPDKHVITQPGIHERRQVVELLKIKRDLGSVLEGAAAGILELDAAGRVAYANPRAEELLGIGRSSLIGTDILSVFPKSGVASFQTLLSRFDADTAPASRVMTSVFDERTIRSVLTSTWSEGVRQSIIVTLLEVASADETQDRPLRLLQYLTHEMRASLLMIEGSLRALANRESRPSQPAAAAEPMPTLSFLAQETARLLRLLGDATKYHRTIRELPEIEMEPMDLVSVVKDSISGITALAVPQGIEVNYRGPAIAPKVRGHHDKLLQVLYNLLLNALKYTPRGGLVRVELGVSDRELTVTVADNGRGMTPAELREVMTQAPRAELFLPRKGKRVGLGLAIAYQIVRAHGGQLSAESKASVGSRFAFTLPLAPPRGSEPAPAAGPAEE